jgi:hypothetical protein
MTAIPIEGRYLGLFDVQLLRLLVRPVIALI